MDSRTATVVVVCLVLAAGCVGSPGGRDLEGTVTVYVGNHDQPVEGFERLNVTVTAITFVPADRASGDANTPTNATGTPTEQFEPLVNRTTVDLTTVGGDSAALVDTVSLPVRERYRRVIVAVTVGDTTLSGGGDATVSVPNGTLTADTGFGVEPGSNTTLLLDVSAVEEGNGTYVLTAAGEPVERNLTTPTSGGSGAGTPGTDTAGANGGDDSSTGTTSPTGTATPTATATATETTATNRTTTEAGSG